MVWLLLLLMTFNHWVFSPLLQLTQGLLELHWLKKAKNFATIPFMNCISLSFKVVKLKLHLLIPQLNLPHFRKIVGKKLSKE